MKKENNSIISEEFEFTEDSLNSEKSRFVEFVSKNIENGFRVCITSPIPPCIMNSLKNPLREHIVEYNSPANKYIIMDKKMILLKHNIVFNQDYKLASHEKYVSTACLNCPDYANHSCKGVVNKAFMKEKGEIEKRLGKDTYYVISSDYSKGKLDFGSICNGNCEFCFNKNFPKDVLKKIPFLSIEEIQHFMYYVPSNFRYIGVSDHTQAGELFFHPGYKQILRIIRPYADGCYWIATNGVNLNEEAIKEVKNLGIPLALSITALKTADVKKICHFPKIPDYGELFRLFSKHGLDFKIFVVPLKKNIKDKTVEKFVEYVINKTGAMDVTFLPPSYNKYTPAKIKRELKHDEKHLLNYLFGLKLKYKKINWMGKRLVDYDVLQKEIRKELKSQLRLLKTVEGEKLILHTKNVSRHIGAAAKELNLKNVHLQEVAPITIGGNITCAGMLLIDDYEHAIQKALKKKIRFDKIVLPSISFGRDLLDISLKSPACLYKKYKTPLVIIKNMVEV